MKNVNVRYLSENEYASWDEFVDISPQGSIFNKSYWLKAVAKEFKILVCEENNKIIGGIAMPLMNKGLYRIPKLTPELGVLLPLYDTKAKYSTRLSKDMEITNELIKAFPDFKLFDYNFNYNFTNYLPFIWQGFNISVAYTYVINDLSDTDEVYNNFQYDVKYTIKKAEKKGIKVVSDYSIEDFFNVNKKTFTRQNMEIPYTLDFLVNLDNVLEQHNNRKMMFAVNEENKVIAAAYLLYDNTCTYYLMGGADPDFRDTGAQTLLLWESIKFASHVSKSFDFEGSIVKNIEKNFREFGGEQKTIYKVYKSDPLTEFLFKIAKKNKNIIRKIFKI